MSTLSRPFTFRQSRGQVPMVICLAFWVGLTALGIGHFGGLALDDFFVTYRYSLNLAEGHGFVFNPGERVFGLSNPGLGLLLAGLYLFTGLEIPWLATAVFGVALLATVGLLLRESIGRGIGVEAFLGGTLILFSSYIWICHGGAAPLVLLLLTAAATLGKPAPALAGGLAGLAVWCRPDAALGVVLLGLLLCWERRKLPWIYAITALSTIGIGLLWALSYFDTLLPITLESKRLLAGLSGNGSSGTEFWLSALTLWQRHGGVLAREIAAIGLAGQVFVLRHSGPAGKVLSLYGLGLALAYPLLGVPFFNWYTVPTAAALLYGAAFFAVGFGRALGRWIGTAKGGPWIGRNQDGPRLGFAVSIALVTLIFFSFGERNLYALKHHSWHHRMVLYRQAAEWIREHSEPSADVSALEIGVLGYFSQRPLEDLLGMVTPRALPFVAERDLRGAFRAKPTEFLLRYNHGSRLNNLFRSPWFRRNYRVVQTFSDPTEAHVVRIYQRKT